MYLVRRAIPDRRPYFSIQEHQTIQAFTAMTIFSDGQRSGRAFSAASYSQVSSEISRFREESIEEAAGSIRLKDIRGKTSPAGLHQRSWLRCMATMQG